MSSSVATEERPARTGPSGLVQPIIVGPGGTHLEVIEAVMTASVGALIADWENPAWTDWLTGAFTKTVRQTHQARVETLAIEATAIAVVGGAQAVAFGPQDYEALPRPIARARVDGLERPRGPQGPIASGLWVWLNGDAPMSTGKAAAQAAHALMVHVLGQRFPVTMPEVKVREVDGPTFAAGCRSNPEGVIRDAGRTEVAPGTATAVVVDVG